MNKKLDNAVVRFLQKVKDSKNEGTIIEQGSLHNLNNKLQNLLPGWFIYLLSNYPLSGAQLDYPVYEADDDGDGCIPVNIATPEDIYDETEKCYPGIAIRHLGYFCFAIDASGSGDQFFIANNKSDDPPVYQVYHHVGDTGEEIEEKGVNKIANSLSDFFTKAIINHYD